MGYILGSGAVRRGRIPVKNPIRLVLSALAVLTAVVVVSAGEFDARVDLKKAKKDGAAIPSVAGAPVTAPPSADAAVPKRAVEAMEAFLAGKSDGTPGGRFFKRQCGWMEGGEKVRCMEHAIALDMSRDPKGAAYSEEDPSNRPFLRLTAEGREFVLTGASDSTGNSGQKDSGQPAQRDAVADCLRSIEGRNAREGLMAKRLLVVLRQTYEQNKVDELLKMGCRAESIGDVDRCWLKTSCPEIQP